MKKVLPIIYIFSFLFLTACKKKDGNPPVITLLGNNSISIPLNTTWSEPGYSASDDKSGDLTENVVVSGSVNSNYAGTYVLTYTVSDFYGNETSLSRVVNVYNEAEFLSGDYTGRDTCQSSPSITYTATITLSNSVNKEFYIQNFGDWDSKCTCNTAIKMNVGGITQGSLLTWSHQSIAGNDTLAASSGGGTILSLSPVQFSLAYQWTNGSSTQTCTGLFIKQ